MTSKRGCCHYNGRLIRCVADSCRLHVCLVADVSSPQAIIELQTGVALPTPLEWAFTQETNEQQRTDVRLDYVNAITDLLVLAL